MIAAVAGGLIYTFYRYRINQLKQLFAVRTKISRDLHDEVGSTLSGIGLLSEMAKQQLENSRNIEVSTSLQKISTHSEEMLGKMSDIVWSLNPSNESFEQLQNRMTAFSAMMLTPRNIVYGFVADDETKNIQLTSEQRKNIFLIYKEAIHNIVRYAECKKVEINFNMEKDNLEMMIKDNGKGFDVASQNVRVNNESLGGNGLKNMQARAEEIHGRFSISSKINEGTKIELILKLN